MLANKNLKNSVFTLLFSDPDLLRELYCAIEGVILPPDTPVTINTLSDALFMDRINDVSFEIGGRLVVLVEHQSTINPNMALRMLMYIARVYEKIIGEKNIYASKLVRIPRPLFVVLYNGVAEFPDEQTLRLSDSFESLAPLGLPGGGTAPLELEVRVLNINHGRNAGIAGKCKALAGYSAFIAKIRELERECGDRAEAVKLAVRHCRSRDILKEFLEKHGTEVDNMLLTEWKMEDALAVRYEEGWEKGRVEGRGEGRAEGRAEGREEAARNALAKGLSPELIREITGLDVDAIRAL